MLRRITGIIFRQSEENSPYPAGTGKGYAVQLFVEGR
ncbi:hypothetical protein CLOLEP_00777 [[Clostridium] leptum DSM 753]|uniref:Uncharacterized protein n=1 Tax=[Clostridium] leptum DSM 753 TaxID=428125 RepID=A7VQE7_9FIRM|nr:hypothetical protein CLOLEP_00777 [[Clostridium] leptum DSM 753]